MDNQSAVYNLYPVITKAPPDSTTRSGSFYVNSMTPITYISRDVDTSASYTLNIVLKLRKLSAHTQSNGKWQNPVSDSEQELTRL